MPCASGLHAPFLHLQQDAHQRQADPQSPVRSAERAVRLRKQVENARQHHRQHETGFDHYYVKPVDLTQLLDLVKTVKPKTWGP